MWLSVPTKLAPDQITTILCVIFPVTCWSNFNSGSEIGQQFISRNTFVPTWVSILLHVFFYSVVKLLGILDKTPAAAQSKLYQLNNICIRVIFKNSSKSGSNICTKQDYRNTVCTQVLYSKKIYKRDFISYPMLTSITLVKKKQYYWLENAMNWEKRKKIRWVAKEVWKLWGFSKSTKVSMNSILINSLH